MSPLSFEKANWQARDRKWRSLGDLCDVPSGDASATRPSWGMKYWKGHLEIIYLLLLKVKEHTEYSAILVWFFVRGGIFYCEFSLSASQMSTANFKFLKIRKLRPVPFVNFNYWQNPNVDCFDFDIMNTMARSFCLSEKTTK